MIHIFSQEKNDLCHLCDIISLCDIRNNVVLTNLFCEKMKKKEFWKFTIQTVISILSAIATAMGVTSCIA